MFSSTLGDLPGGDWIFLLTDGLSMFMGLGAKFTQTLGFGDLYFGLDVPFLLAATGDLAELFEIGAFDFAALNITLGVDTEMGIGGGLGIHGWIGDSDMNDDFLQMISVFVNYSTDALFAQLTVEIPAIEDGIDMMGLTIIPEVAYSLDMGLKLYAALPIFGVGADYDDSIGIGLTIGAKFSF